MRPLMRFAEAMHDNEVRKASKAAIAAIPDARKACDALTALTGIGVATASVCLAAVDDRLPVMSDEALEAVLGEPEHAKKYDLDSYQRLRWAPLCESQEARGVVDAARRRRRRSSPLPRAAGRQTQARRLERRERHRRRDANNDASSARRSTSTNRPKIAACWRAEYRWRSHA